MRIPILLSSLLCSYCLGTPTPGGPTAPPKGIITPVAPKSPNGLGMFVDADFTWWKSKVSGMSFAEVNNRTISTASQFRPGFKIGIGLDMDFDGWDTYAEYTWFYQPWHSNSASSSKSDGFSSFVHFDPASSLLSSLTIESAYSSRKEQFNILDLEFARNFFISKRITLRPLFGIKLARMLERTKTVQQQKDEAEKVKVFLSQSLSGAGIRAGMDTFWHITDNFGLYGDIALTALWSRLHNHFSSYFFTEDETTKRASKLNSQTILPVVELGLGLAYETWFAKERYQLYAKAGWEEQVWVGYNYNNPNGTVNNTGNLTLQGLTAKIGLAF